MHSGSGLLPRGRNKCTPVTELRRIVGRIECTWKSGKARNNFSKYKILDLKENENKNGRKKATLMLKGKENQNINRANHSNQKQSYLLRNQNFTKPISCKLYFDLSQLLLKTKQTKIKHY